MYISFHDNVKIFNLNYICNLYQKCTKIQVQKSIKNRFYFLDNNNKEKLKKILNNNGKINLKKRRLQQMV